MTTAPQPPRPQGEGREEMSVEITERTAETCRRLLDERDAAIATVLNEDERRWYSKSRGWFSRELIDRLAVRITRLEKESALVAEAAVRKCAFNWEHFALTVRADVIAYDALLKRLAFDGHEGLATVFDKTRMALSALLPPPQRETPT